MTHSPEQITVLYVSGYSNMAGGGQVSLLLLLRLLDRQRFLPVLLCPDEGEVSRRARALGVRVDLLGAEASIDSWEAAGHALALRRHVRASGAALVHCDTLYTALMSGVGLIGLRAPIVFHARSSESGGALDRIVPGLCKRVIAVSHATARRFSSCAPSRVVVIHNGVDLSDFLPGTGRSALREKLEIAQDTFVVGYAGQLVKLKGLDVLIQAFSRLRTEFSDTTLLLAGRGPDEAALRAMAGQGVHFLPFTDSMPQFYAALDVFALPTSHQEGLSRSLIEAMACAVPAVATPLGGNVETLVDGETGFFVPALDAAALSQRLRDLYLAPEQRRKMAVAARERAEKMFDAVACTHAVEAVYRQAVA